MGYHADPTANAALGNINREFSKREKRAEKLLKLLAEGKLSPQALEQVKAQPEFQGIFRHVFTTVQAKNRDER